MRHRLRIALLSSALAVGWTSSAAAQAEWGWSPGIKLSWSPGQRVVYGLELSFVRVPDLLDNRTQSLVSALLDTAGRVITRTYGLVFSVDSNFHGFASTRLGVEWVGPFLGLELGPALVRDANGRHIGLGLTAWAGYDLYGFYTHTFVRGSDSVDQFGLMLKTPLLSFGSDGSIDFDDDN